MATLVIITGSRVAEEHRETSHSALGKSGKVFGGDDIYTKEF